MTDVFDADKAWASLTPEQQAEIGKAAISYVVYAWAFDAAEDEYWTDYTAKAGWEAESRLIDLVATGCPDAKRAMIIVAETEGDGWT